MIAALYVQSGGAYHDLAEVDPWDIARDARKYDGPYPVVAHPPCQLWGRFAKINFARWGGEHNRPGNDGGCFVAALASVRRWGGVLEHPADSYAFAAYGLSRPAGIGWVEFSNGEWVCEVWQSAYGHLARKRTWLFYCGPRPFELRWDRFPGTHQIGYRDYNRPTNTNKPTIGKAAASATPIAFRDELIQLAIDSQNSRLTSED